MSNQIKKILNINSIISFVIVITAISFYSIKYYKNGELVFQQNQFKFYIAFVLFVILGFSCLFYLNVDSRKIIDVLRNDLKLRDETIVKLFNVISNKLDINQDSNVELHRNTRDIMLTCMQNENHSVKKKIV